MYITQSLFSIPPLFAKSWKLTACVFSTPSLTCKGGSFEPLGTPSPTRLQITQLSVSIGAVKAKLIKRICGLSNFIAFIAMRLICFMYSNFPGSQFLRAESKFRRAERNFCRRAFMFSINRPKEKFHLVQCSRAMTLSEVLSLCLRNLTDCFFLTFIPLTLVVA